MNEPLSSTVRAMQLLCSSAPWPSPLQHFSHENSSSIPTKPAKSDIIHLQRNFEICSCGRRHLLGAAAASALFPIQSSKASASSNYYETVLNKVHPSRPEWYEEFYASTMATSMQSYEAEIAGYKSHIFGKLKGKAEKILEIGIGTGPNLKYYATADPDLYVYGVDPNKKMEKYALAAAKASGLAPENFSFAQAVGEALPFGDNSVDAVVGTLVLCSVYDVDATLHEVKRVLKPGGLYLFVEHVAAQDGSFLKTMQTLLDPLQQTLADGCHLTRESGKSISQAGFLGLDLSTTYTSNFSLVSPLVYGSASK